MRSTALSSQVAYILTKEVRTMAHQQSISIHKPRLGGNAMWVFLALGIVLLVGLSFLSVQWFLLGVVIVVAVMCLFLFRWHNQHKLEFNDLSRLEESTDETLKD